MDTFSEQRFREALAGAVRGTLERGEVVTWPGLGTFRVEHRPSAMEEQSDGTFVMTPPREEIVFEADVP